MSVLCRIHNGPDENQCPCQIVAYEEEEGSVYLHVKGKKLPAHYAPVDTIRNRSGIRTYPIFIDLYVDLLFHFFQVRLWDLSVAS